LLQNGTYYRCISLFDFFNLFQNPSTPFKKVHKKSRPEVKSVSKIVTKDKSQQQIDEILIKLANLVMIV
jgi:hypothetical protein